MSSSQDEEVYDVETICAHKNIRGKLHYLIKWVGYPESENTWELEENLLCEEMLQEYKEKKKKPTKQTKLSSKANVKKTEQKSTPTKENKKVVTDKSQSLILDKSQKFKRIITNEWDESIASIIGAHNNKEGKLEIELSLKDGSKAIASSEEVRYKAPLKLLDFYEENLAFPE